MKREDLQKIEGLSKEQIDSIMNLHKVDAEQYKKDIEAKDTEISARDTKISDLSNTVKQFDGVDVSKLQQEVKDWEAKYHDDLTAAKKDSAIKLAIASSKAKSEKALMAFIDTDIVKVNEDGTVTGLKEQLENIKKENGFLFNDEKPETPKDVDLGGGHEDKPAVKEVSMEDAIGEYYDDK